MCREMQGAVPATTAALPMWLWIAAAALLICTAALSSSAKALTLPFWPQYPARSISDLSGTWDFGYVANVSDVLNVDPSIAVFNETAIVPSAFDVAQPGVMGPRGTAFYRRNVSFPVNKAGFLYFAACSFYCQVFVDGVSQGDHRAGGYQPFRIPFPASPKTEREIIVVADNRFNATTAPTHTGGDFYMYGGITRDVFLHEIPAPTYIEQAAVFTMDMVGTVKVRITLAGAPAVQVLVNYRFDNNSAWRSDKLDVDGSIAEFTATVPQASYWSLDEPNLHVLHLTINNGSDAIDVRFGLRILGSQDGRFTINNKPVKLHGVNRHTMWPDTGSALTLEQVKTDVGILQEVGANYVRGAHYPQDQRFLDLCDEVGIAVWEETLGPDVRINNLLNPYFMKYQIEAVREMVTTSINHPSVVFHGFYNEGPSDDPLACPGYNASASAIRALTSNGTPRNRLVTWASDHKTSDRCLHITDVVSFNSYPGWYDHKGNLSEPKVFWQSQVAWVEENFSDKPFTISETGGGGIYEWRNETDPYWSQKYQAELVQQDIEFALGNARTSGLTIWQFNDIKADDSATQSGPCDYKPHPANLSVPWDCAYIDVSVGRPGGENHKGVVDFWRRKKDAFSVMQALYKGSTPPADA